MLPPAFIGDSPIYQWAWSGGLFVGFALLAVVVSFLMRRMSSKLQPFADATPVAELLQALSGFVFFILLLQAVFLGVGSISYVQPYRGTIERVDVVVTIVLLTVGIGKAAVLTVRWSVTHVKANGKPYVDEAMLPLFKLSAIVVVYAIGVLVLLDQLQVSITPLVAGLGIGGLAIALALQPTLANFFAGTQIASDKLLRAGDYVELDGGNVRGYVVDVGWRSTRIRTAFNNLVVVPNSRLAESVITNYYGPTLEMAVIVTMGVSLNSDLEHVERVAKEAASAVIHELPEADSTTEPWVGFDKVAESNVEFWVWGYAKNRLASFTVTSELIKRLFKRFREEGIEVSFPVRKLLPADAYSLAPVRQQPDQATLRNGGADAAHKEG